MADATSSEHKLLSKHRFTNAFRPIYANKKIAALAILVFAAIGVTATYVTNAAQVANEETVLLSAGRQIKLGQNIETVKASLGDKLFKLNDHQYIYRQKANDPIEAVVDLDTSKNVVVIHLTNRPNNVIAATGSRVGMNILGVKYYFHNTRPLPPAIAKLRSSGVVVDQSRSSQYFTPDACGSGQQASLVSLVLKGHEARYINDLGTRDCNKD